MTRNKAQAVKNFIYSQSAADGLRMTAAILLPALIASYFNQFSLGLSFSLGALCVSLTDAPGPFVHKRNGMLTCALLIFGVALTTALARTNSYLMGLEIFVFCFFFSMFTLYGNRASAVGNATILAMILTMDEPMGNQNIFLHSVLILGGGFWYLVISLLLSKMRPYRAAQRALGECVREVATYLSIKADFYNTATDLETNYRKLVTQQIVVSEKQDTARELLFKTRVIVNESTPAGRKLVMTFVDTVDLFEDATAAYYDYTALRKRFEATGMLGKVAATVHHMANELYQLGVAIQVNSPYKKKVDFDAELKMLKEAIDAISKESTESNLVLKKILINIRNLAQRIADISSYFEAQPARQHGARLDHDKFVAHQSLDPKIFWNNLTFESAIFKHSLRVAFACLTGFVLAKWLAYGEHSYWILLTIAFILKPAFSLTAQRNKERIVGTLIGGAIGVFILYFIPNKTVQFLFMVLFMMGTYSFLRINYLAMVICTTPYVIILFNFFGLGFIAVAQERILDTVIGCAIAFAASYLLFPTWESEGVKSFMQQMLKANERYLQKIVEGLYGNKISLLQYKLVRKEVYVSSANLSAAFQRMLSEPESKQKNSKQLHQFVVLNHILFSNIATVVTTLMSREARMYPQELVHLAKRSLYTLDDGIKKMDSETGLTEPVEKKLDAAPETATSEDDVLLKEQLHFIYKLSTDITKTTDKLIAS